MLWVGPGIWVEPEMLGAVSAEVLEAASAEVLGQVAELAQAQV